MTDHDIFRSWRFQNDQTLIFQQRSKGTVRSFCRLKRFYFTKMLPYAEWEKSSNIIPVRLVLRLLASPVIYWDKQNSSKLKRILAHMHSKHHRHVAFCGHHLHFQYIDEKNIDSGR